MFCSKYVHFWLSNISWTKCISGVELQYLDRAEAELSEVLVAYTAAIVLIRINPMLSVSLLTALLCMGVEDLQYLLTTILPPT